VLNILGEIQLLGKGAKGDFEGWDSLQAIVSEGQGGTAPANARTTPLKGRFDLLYPVPCDDIDVSQARPRW